MDHHPNHLDCAPYCRRPRKWEADLAVETTDCFGCRDGPFDRHDGHFGRRDGRNGCRDGRFVAVTTVDSAVATDETVVSTVESAFPFSVACGDMDLATMWRLF